MFIIVFITSKYQGFFELLILFLFSLPWVVVKEISNLIDEQSQHRNAGNMKKQGSTDSTDGQQLHSNRH
jgi:hypothetical protein